MILLGKFKRSKINVTKFFVTKNIMAQEQSTLVRHISMPSTGGLVVTDRVRRGGGRDFKKLIANELPL